jgi:hypothetical protein
MYQGKCYGGVKRGMVARTLAPLFIATDEGREIGGGKVYGTSTYHVHVWFTSRGWVHYYLADRYILTPEDRAALDLACVPKTCAACPDNGGSGPWCNGCHNG